jgi:hypothetical protein
VAADTDADDPVKRDPLGAVEELLETITHRTQVVEAGKRRTRDLDTNSRCGVSTSSRGWTGC